MRFSTHKKGNREYTIRQVPSFAFIPETINNPERGYIWLEFYNKVYEYRNCAWHFEGKLHKHFPRAKFTNNENVQIEIEYLEASSAYKILYFVRCFFILLLWIGIVYGIIYLFHHYLK